MGPRAGLDGRKISPQTGIRFPDRPARSSVAIPTELPGPHRGYVTLAIESVVKEYTNKRTSVVEPLPWSIYRLNHGAGLAGSKQITLFLA